MDYCDNLIRIFLNYYLGDGQSLLGDRVYKKSGQIRHRIPELEINVLKKRIRGLKTPV
jgi:hypothetical protein